MEIQHNYLPQQYKETNTATINHNYLKEQFSDYKEIFIEIEKLIHSGDYTLGNPVNEFEKKISEITGAKYVIGVGSGTDALFLSLKASGIKEGDEVITTPYTFFATIGAIVTAGAKPIFVDIDEDYNINPKLIEQAITKKTKVILPVHWSGTPCKMDQIMEIAKKYNLEVIEDACHAINGKYMEKAPGTFGIAGCFSMHPLKNLNVWGDGGFIITNSKEMHNKLVLLRNHGLINRDECGIFAYNSRLDTIQAIVANHLLRKLDHITESRIKNAHFFDQELSKIKEIKIPTKYPKSKNVYHIYAIRAKNRNELKQFLVNNGIDAKIHYPIPMHLQPAAKDFGYQKGDFPVTESICESVISLPVHEFITQEQQRYIINKIKEFYETKKVDNKLIAQKEKSSEIKIKFVDLGAQYTLLKSDIINKFDELSSQGDYILSSELKKFEENFASFCETKYAVGVANGTDALILSLKALGIKEGDEVITVPNSFVATAGAITAIGAKPVFVDVREDYNINPNLIKDKITEKTKAIIPVHLTGRIAAMDEILNIAKEYNLSVIEDAAQAIGAKYKGKKAGSFGNTGCFSLHPLKNLHVQGDGGVITTNDAYLYEKLIKLRNHGLKNRDECELWGLNSRLDVIQAAIGNIKLNYIDEWNQKHQKIAEEYKKGLKDVIKVPTDTNCEQPVYHNFIIQTNNREKLQKYLLEKGIETKIHYPIPIHLQEAAKSLGYRKGDFPVCEEQAKKILSLPIHPELTYEQIEEVIENIVFYMKTY